MLWILKQVTSNYPLDSELIADWLELNTLSQDDNAIGFDKLRSLASEILDLPPQRIDVAFNILKRRSEILQDSYPFDIKSVGMVRRQNWRELPYTYLLRISSGIDHPFSLSLDENADRIESFEHLVVHALQNLLGVNSKAVRFGFPSEDRPVEFPKAIEWLSDRMGIKAGQAYRPPRRKDGGVDVVAWRPFRDRRNGFPVYLVQVTCERNYSHKVFDIDLRLWSGWLNLDTDPVSVLAVPTTISVGEEWNEISTKVVVLERIRICELLAISDVEVLLDDNGKRSSWIIRAKESL
jgi:hypothetical protein